ncbi:mannosyl-3-phosphoglycerate phosphatase-related protein [Rouxiella chamberiensis]|uniref:Mannosyl-3-phosphoglycerate phosphatase-related protein n=1 Tax=Rouxiella chamberiensis TaxID=1513468 RepID=A0ABY7HUC4_9GAMM|nr:mannosyl-3-phosphoglycerate phosphatase-related protein [Rouxiella chamberiensis]WAT03021.1 mannosyl-3-phosphoglycerate phosphatase-related protein [Rouxiella chamberiensis]
MPYLDDNLVVFTDLDGSLLDHNDYSWQPAQEWLDRLRAARVPVILTTSKTAVEVDALQEKLQLADQPFIAENGAMIRLPAGWHEDGSDRAGQIIGASYQAIRHTLVALRQRYDFEFRGFGDVGAQQVIDWTGLSPENAHQAMQREASEPIIWFGNDLDFARFEKSLHQEQLALTRGGRFWHVMGADAGKGQAVNWLREQYQLRTGKPVVTLGLGDGPNDIGMLNATDFSVVIRGHHEHPMPLDNEAQVFRTGLFGPEGWKQGLDHFVSL